MSQAALADPPVTIAAFDAFVAAQRDDSLWELVAGAIVAMTSPSEVHEQIVGNIGAPLKLAMDAKDCGTYMGGLAVQRSDDTRGMFKPRPDIVVRCGPVSTRTYVVDPLVIVEVLSPSTLDHDRGDKLRFYNSLPTLRHAALVYQDQMRVEHYRRQDTGWTLETLTRPQARLGFEALPFEIALERIYFRVAL